MNKEDKAIVLDIMATAYHESDRLRPLLRKGKKDQRIRIMSTYAYDLAVKFNGLYLSQDKSTAIVYWVNSEYKRSPLDMLKYLIMFLRTLKLSKMFKTIKREKIVESMRMPLDDYLYVWLLGKDPNVKSIRGLAEIRDHLNERSKERGLPVLIETTVEKLVKLYQFVGFELYSEYFDDTIGLPVYFLKKDVVKE